MQSAKRLTGHDRGLGSLCLGACAFRGQGDEAVQQMIEAGDPAEACLGEFHGRQLARGDELRRLGDSQVGRVRHDLVFYRQEFLRHEGVRRLVAMRSRRRDAGDHRPDMVIGFDQFLKIGRRQIEAGLAGEADDFVLRWRVGHAVWVRKDDAGRLLE